MLYVLAKENANTGNIRETFILNQLQHIHSVHLPGRGDFLVDDTYTIEVGGKGKSKSQINDLEHAYVAKDQIEVGFDRVIPVWLFGFLY